MNGMIYVLAQTDCDAVGDYDDGGGYEDDARTYVDHYGNVVVLMVSTSFYDVYKAYCDITGVENDPDAIDNPNSIKNGVLKWYTRRDDYRGTSITGIRLGVFSEGNDGMA